MVQPVTKPLCNDQESTGPLLQAAKVIASSPRLSSGPVGFAVSGLDRGWPIEALCVWKGFEMSCRIALRRARKEGSAIAHRS